MKIGFTGTQMGMSQNQQIIFCRMVQETLKITEFHHGDCIGADKQVHDIVKDYTSKIRVVIHPPDNNTKRAYCSGDEIRLPQPYIQRNHNIVDETDGLIAIPYGPEIRRSGTWATVRYARKLKKMIYIINPDGTMS